MTAIGFLDGNDAAIRRWVEFCTRPDNRKHGTMLGLAKPLDPTYAHGLQLGQEDCLIHCIDFEKVAVSLRSHRGGELIIARENPWLEKIVRSRKSRLAREQMFPAQDASIRK